VRLTIVAASNRALATNHHAVAALIEDLRDSGL
jgi:hypothetical protein